MQSIRYIITLILLYINNIIKTFSDVTTAVTIEDYNLHQLQLFCQHLPTVLWNSYDIRYRYFQENNNKTTATVINITLKIQREIVTTVFD